MPSLPDPNARPKANILLVDDHPGNLLALEAVLESPDYTIFKAASGHEALDLVRVEEFATILLDLQMPGMDGYETARRIKSMPNGKDIPVIFVTAVYREDEDIVRGYDAGAVDYFAKPFRPNVIKTKVQIYADLYRKTRLLRDRERARLDAMLDPETQGVIVTDARGRITQANHEARRIWGGGALMQLESCEEFPGWWASNGKRIRAEEWALARAVGAGEVSKNEVVRIQCFDGTEKTIINSASPLRDSQGLITGAVCVLQDITARDDFRSPAAAQAAARGG